MPLSFHGLFTSDIYIYIFTNIHEFFNNQYIYIFYNNLIYNSHSKNALLSIDPSIIFHTWRKSQKKILISHREQKLSLKNIFLEQTLSRLSLCSLRG